VSPTRRARTGFTLTEILMAVGILGVGLTMVASVFPVAVDQSRRGRDLTLASLAARSGVAMLRARRHEVAGWCRAKTAELAKGAAASQVTVEIPSAASVTADGKSFKPLPADFNVYNPVAFLYEQTADKKKDYRKYDTSATGYSQWAGGNYVPMFLMTPLGPAGPWRITIVVFRGKGSAVTPNVTWQTRRGEQGDYLLDPSLDFTQNNYRGEAYLIENLFTVAGAPNPTTDRIVLAVTRTPHQPQNWNLIPGLQYAQAAPDSPKLVQAAPAGCKLWYSLPGAIIAFHTIVGD